MKKTRWIQATLATSTRIAHPMPWHRGARRAQMIARRQKLALSA